MMVSAAIPPPPPRRAGEATTEAVQGCVTEGTSRSAHSVSLSLTDGFRGSIRREMRQPNQCAFRSAGETRLFKRTHFLFSFPAPETRSRSEWGPAYVDLSISVPHSVCAVRVRCSSSGA